MLPHSINPASIIFSIGNNIKTENDLHLINIDVFKFNQPSETI